MSGVVHQPERGHHCGVNAAGVWWESRPIPEHDDDYALGHRTRWRQVGTHDPAGLVRACDSCGKTWVAHDPPKVHSGLQLCMTEWRPEGRIARWWRERKAAGDA